MIIYGAIFIPILTAIVLYIFFRHKTVWWEFSIPLGASFLFIVLMKFIIETAMVQSKEYWGSFISRIEYFEEWDEWIDQTCTRSCCCDSNGENCGTETYDCSYRLYHPPCWQIITSTEEVVSISQSEYNRLTKFFGNQKFTDMHRGYYTIDGDKYSCDWMRDSIKAIPVTTVHYYENRIKVADQSVFHFQEVDTGDVQKFKLKDYPGITDSYKQDAVLGDYSNDAKLANQKFKYINGLLGHKKEVRLFVLVFQNQPIDAGFYQEWYWSGANMNELAVGIGADYSRRVKWCHPISWTPAEKLKTDIKQFIISQDTLNLSALASYMQIQVDKQFIRRNFEEFDYLTVEPPTWAIALAYVMTILLNTGLSLWVITNEIDESGDKKYK